MDIIYFRNWLINQNKNKKIISDIISRIKKVELLIGSSIDEQYKKDSCDFLLSLFNNKGINDQMNNFIINSNVSMPIGKYHLSAYKYAANTYINYLKSL